MGRQMMRKPLPSREFLESLLSYNPETGYLTWKVRGDDFAAFAGWSKNTLAIWNAKFAGKTAKRSLMKGYVGITILSDRYFAHRVIWKMVTGIDPDHIDHINGLTGDNRIENLRDVSAVENQRNRKINRNNTSGFTGVNLCPATGRYLSRISVGNGAKNLGRFDTLEEAIAARKSAEKSLNYSETHGRA